MKKPKYAELEFFRLLVDHFGGLARLADILQMEYWEFNNWMHRGYVPCSEILNTAKVLNVPTAILNNKAFHYIVDWKALLKEVRFLSPSEVMALTKLPLRYK